MGEALESTEASVAQSSTPNGYEFPHDHGDHVDFVFISTEFLADNIRDLTARGMEHNPNLRVILLDGDGSCHYPPAEVGAHSLAALTPENAKVIARYWSTCLYPP